MPKFKLIISKPAQRDLAGIYNYTLTNWGESQLKKYAIRFDDGFGLILENPLVGKKMSNHHFVQVENHLIFYKIDGNQILISRILHKKMKFADFL